MAKLPTLPNLDPSEPDPFGRILAAAASIRAERRARTRATEAEQALHAAARRAEVMRIEAAERQRSATEGERRLAAMVAASMKVFVAGG